MPDKIYFLVSPENISDNIFILDRDESHHLINVLRKSIGTELWLINGIGSAYTAVISEIANGIVSGEILEHFPNYGENKIHIDLGVGILKQSSKMDMVVEKATECGVRSITPLIMDHCIKRKINHLRLNKIAKSSTKQCGRSHIPTINYPMTLNEWCQSKQDSKIIVGHQSGEKIIPRMGKQDNRLAIVIGPEGDFTSGELNMLKEYEAEFVSLGHRRLRSETAVISILSVMNCF